MMDEKKKKDLEKCKEALNKELEEWQREFIERLKEYREWCIKEMLKDHIFRTERYIYNLN